MPVRIDYKQRLLVPASVAASLLSTNRERIYWLLANKWLVGTRMGTKRRSKILVSMDSLERYAADPPRIAPWELPEDGGLSYAERERHLRRLRAAHASLGGDDVVHSMRDGVGGSA